LQKFLSTYGVLTFQDACIWKRKMKVFELDTLFYKITWLVKTFNILKKIFPLKQNQVNLLTF